MGALVSRAALIGALVSTAIFMLAEGIHHAGFNPFSPAGSEATTPASAKPASVAEPGAGVGVTP